MTVGIVSLDVALTPDDFPDAQITFQIGFHLGFFEAAVAVGIEQALLGGDAQALAVDLDGSAFQNNPGLEAGYSN